SDVCSSDLNFPVEASFHRLPPHGPNHRNVYTRIALRPVRQIPFSVLHFGKRPYVLMRRTQNGFLLRPEFVATPAGSASCIYTAYANYAPVHTEHPPL